MTSPHGPGRTDAAGGIDHGTAALRAETLSAETLSAENLTAEKLSAKKQGAVNRDAFHLGAIGAGLAFAGSLPALQAALDGSNGAAVVQAPPGTGKTTLVPPLVANLLTGTAARRVVVTQPRGLRRARRAPVRTRNAGGICHPRHPASPPPG